MIDFLVVVGVALVILMFPLMWRVTRGPTVLDRIVAVNVIGTKTTILVIIIGAVFGRLDMFIDIALTYALLNFIVSIAAARYFQRRGIQPHDRERFEHTGTYKHGEHKWTR